MVADNRDRPTTLVDNDTHGQIPDASPPPPRYQRHEGGRKP
jgi:hypothetical protein